MGGDDARLDEFELTRLGRLCYLDYFGRAPLRANPSAPMRICSERGSCLEFPAMCITITDKIMCPSRLYSTQSAARSMLSPNCLDNQTITSSCVGDDARLKGAPQIMKGRMTSGTRLCAYLHNLRRTAPEKGKMTGRAANCKSF